MFLSMFDYKVVCMHIFKKMGGNKMGVLATIDYIGTCVCKKPKQSLSKGKGDTQFIPTSNIYLFELKPHEKYLLGEK